ncbi:MAG: hypothetical protein ACM3MK_12895 [Chitinophagales bacterium]
MSNLRMMFPGGNTCKGFFSFYDYIVRPDAKRVFVLKGGPGVGKSSLMKNLGYEFLDMGYNVEFHWCSSDNASLDAMVLADYQVALIDGTAPHIVDPRSPGAVDEIINLGEYWNQSRLEEHRLEIINYNLSVARLFRLAYLRLAEAKAIYTTWEEFNQPPVSPAIRRDIVKSIKEQILASCDPLAREPWQRHLFAAAITPEGIINYSKTLIDDDYRLIIIKGAPGSGVQKIVGSMVFWIQEEEIPAEIYHNPFNPDLVDIIKIPNSKIALVDGTGIVARYDCLNDDNLKREVFELEVDVSEKVTVDFSNRFSHALAGAVDYINQAKQCHDQMETIYIPAMHFDRVELKKAEIKERIIEVIKKSS